MVVVAILGLLMAILVPTIVKSIAASREVACAENLRQIGQALYHYSSTNDGQFPRTVYSSGQGSTAYDPGSGGSGYGPGAVANNVPAAIFHLAAVEDLPSKVLSCPRAGASSDRADGSTLDYAMASPYPTDVGLHAGFKLSLGMHNAGEFAVFADMGPVTGQDETMTADSPAQILRTGNSKNHRQRNQNVLYADGHVANLATPFAGVARDNIYTYGATPGTFGTFSLSGSPAAPWDSYLLPVR
jgi:prepilin-type processing-associated H-X9-DG protein